AKHVRSKLLTAHSAPTVPPQRSVRFKKPGGFPRRLASIYSRRSTPGEGPFMPVKQLQGVIHHLRRTVGARGLREVPDAELLRRFRADRDEAAFELLVWRHGKMVFNVCGRV